MSIGAEERLIEMVKSHEPLYNTKCSEYKDAALRHAAWTEIADILGKTIEECKEEWSRLRNCFTNAVKRRRKRPGQILAPWRFEEQMGFLKPHVVDRSGHNYSVSNTTVYEDSFTEREIKQDEEDITFAGDEDNIQSDSPIAFKRKASSEDETYEIIEPSGSYSRQGNDFDDTDHFFLSMSKMVKKLPKLDQSRIKLDLHKAISEAEVRQLDQPPRQRIKDEKRLIKVFLDSL